MELVDEIKRINKEVGSILSDYVVGHETVATLEKKKDLLLDLAKLSYQFYLNKLEIEDINEDFFAWKNSNVLITLVLLSDFELGYRTTIGFAETSEENEIKIVDATNFDLPYSFYKKFKGTEKISYLHQKSIISIDPEKIIISSLKNDIKFIDFWAKRWVLKEFENIDTFIMPSIELLNFNESIIRAKRYNFEEMLTEINNEQFTIEFDECLYAYNNEKWFVCAAGLGGILEHLLYLILEKNNMIDNNFPDDATAKVYIEYLSRKPINLRKREKTHLRSLFLIRNSVSHYNQGFTSKDQCMSLLNGIKNVFNNYYRKDFNL
ncbi:MULTISPECIES: hypothetical protein [unclassified Enterococcus]|uniref:hypothetical protein n=1 Tax=unclassified Enterococcus TaxID=2608891 RepID=UPI00259B69CE|nr:MULTISPECIES: hypothetical protein [unclassified Enterococcus]MDO0920469.1 hypothetical protein [Enterococcus sp. B1E2]WIV16943.1 hypothetical protein QN079_07510 [Enterococcus sp. FZMF]